MRSSRAKRKPVEGENCQFLKYFNSGVAPSCYQSQKQPRRDTNMVNYGGDDKDDDDNEPEDSVILWSHHRRKGTFGMRLVLRQEVMCRLFRVEGDEMWTDLKKK